MEMKFSLNYSENVQEVEKEKKFFFLQYLIEKVSECSNGIGELEYVLDLDYADLDIENKIKLDQILEKEKIQVIDEEDMEVYMDNDLIGVWYKPTYKLKRDYDQIDYRKQLYQEMSCSFKTVFDKEE